MLTLGPRTTSTSRSTASAPISSPTWVTTSASQVAASAVPDGNRVDVSRSSNPRLTRPSGPSTMITCSTPSSGAAAVLHPFSPPVSRAVARSRVSSVTESADVDMVLTS